MRFNIVIPARYDSSRLPGKPLLEIGGIPMVVRTAMRAGESGAKSVIIATDDQRIVTTAEEYGFEALMTDKNHLSGTDRVLEVAKQKEWANEEIIINVQGDEPLINPELVRLVAQSIHDNNVSYVSACSNFESFDEYLNLNNVKVIFGSKNVEINPAGTVEIAANRCFASGHHHLLVNIENPPKSFIPFDNGHLHFGGGQTETVLNLEPGTYSLQLILGSYIHNSRMQVNNFAGQGPFLSEKITIKVN